MNKNKKIITPFYKPIINSNNWDNLRLGSIVSTATDSKNRYYLFEFEVDLLGVPQATIYGGRIVWDSVENTFYNYRLSDGLSYHKSFTSSLGITYYLDINEGYIPTSLVLFINEYSKKEEFKAKIEKMIVDALI